MDILPLEIKKRIMSYLDGYNLWKCFHICKSWREAADDNLLWGKVLKREDIDMENNSVKSDGKLCKHAQLWYEWIAGPTTMWKNDSSDCKKWYQQVPVSGIQPVYTGYKEFLVFYLNYKSNQIHLYSNTGKEEIEIPIKKLDSLPHIHKIKMNDDFLVASTFSNGLLIFHKKENRFVYEMSYAIVEDDLKIVDLDYNEDCLLMRLCSFIIISLWYDQLVVSSYNSQYYFIVNLKDGTIQTFIHHTDIIYFFVSTNFLVIRDFDCFTIYDKLGTVKLNIFIKNYLNERAFISYCSSLNNEIFLVVSNRTLVTYCIESGEKLSQIRSFLPLERISYKRNILYMYANKRYSVESWVIAQRVTDNIPLWKTYINNVTKIKVIDQKYVHVSTYPLKWYLLDIKTGDILHEEICYSLYTTDYFSIIPEYHGKNILEYITNNFRINRYIINSYFPKYSLI